jgi:glycosyltransferase involved in cell wall biosynthesis
LRIATAAPARVEAPTKLPAVAVVGPLPPPYHGVAVSTDLVLRSGIARQCRVVHVETTDRRGLQNIGRLDVGNILLAVLHVARMIRVLVAMRPSVVYAPLAQNRLGMLRDAALLMPALLMGRRVVLHVHGSELTDLHDTTDALTRAVLRALLQRARRVIVLGESLRGPLERLIPKERITVLPNGLEDEFGGQLPRRRRTGALRVLYLGNVRRAKGYIVALEAVFALRRRGVDVMLDVAGGFSSEHDRAEAMAASAPLGQAVAFHGVVAGPAKRALLERADIFIMPSFSEGHPYVLLEAMSAGLPIVASALPTIMETLEHGQSALLVPAGDAEAAAAALEMLASDMSLRDRMGREARRRYEAEYSFHVWSDRLGRVVEEVLK